MTMMTMVDSYINSSVITKLKVIHSIFPMTCVLICRFGICRVVFIDRLSVSLMITLMHHRELVGVSNLRIEIFMSVINT